jgi:hypothetical protein
MTNLPFMLRASPPPKTTIAVERRRRRLGSNHGGRQLDHGRGSIEGAVEVVEAGRKADIIMDGGILRGTDTQP